jgi:hypothetical protein
VNAFERSFLSSDAGGAHDRFSQEMASESKVTGVSGHGDQESCQEVNESQGGCEEDCQEEVITSSQFSAPRSDPRNLSQQRSGRANMFGLFALAGNIQGGSAAPGR